MQTFGRTVPTAIPLRSYLGTGADVGIEGLLLDDMNPFQACEQGSFTHVSAFLLGGVDPSTSTMRGVSLLHYAAKAGQALIVRFLIDNGATVDAADNDGMTPLMYACAEGQGDTIRMLVEARADTGLRCRYGHSCYYYAAPHHIAFHFLTTFAPMPKTQVEEEELLHYVAGTKGNRFSILYLVEQVGANPNLKSSKQSGGTPLHAAVMTGDLDMVKALVSKGADATITDGSGVRPAALPKCPSQCSQWLKKYLAEPSLTRRQQLALPDFSNWDNVFNWKEFRSTLFYFVVPHWMIVVGGYVHPLLSVVCFAGTLTFFASVASFSLKQKNRCVACAGFFFGGLCIALVQYYQRVAPVFAEDHPGSWNGMLGLVFFTAAMGSYLKTVMSDPGCVQSTADQRKMFYDICFKPSELEKFDHTAMVRKPLRSKHCTKTHQCVKRFDHFCVWTGNAVGSGNHRYFVAFTTCMVFSLIFWGREILYYLTEGAISRQLPPGSSFSSFGDMVAFYFNQDNFLVSYFGIFYALFTFLFTAVMSMTHWNMILRNVTSNENWFPDRYTWLFKLNGNVYNLYDEGKWRNLVNFWFGDLGVEHHSNPEMSPYLKKIVNDFTAKLKGAQSGGGCGSQCGDSSCSVSPAAATTHSLDASRPGVAPADSVAITLEQIPQNKQLEVQITQMMFTQLLQGATEARAPDGTALSADRVAACALQANKMLAKYRERIGNAGRQQEEKVPLTVVTSHEERKRH